MDVLEIVEARHQTGSTIFCSQFDHKGWHEKIGEDTLADAILDRIVHDSYTVLIDGDISIIPYETCESVIPACNLQIFS
ncbi:MAG: ATP-binding protein [Syntrophomonas sp.]